MSEPYEKDFNEKSRRLIYNSGLREFPVVFELYVRAFQVDTDLDAAMAEIVSIIRTSENSDVAWRLFNHYLDSIEAI